MNFIHIGCGSGKPVLLNGKDAFYHYESIKWALECIQRVTGDLHLKKYRRLWKIIERDFGNVPGISWTRMSRKWRRLRRAAT